MRAFFLEPVLMKISIGTKVNSDIKALSFWLDPKERKDQDAGILTRSPYTC
tara:strand:- start:50758 stop:50910 length:153 start_codon:yes stop_codon:yes gene_type:complete